MDGGLDSLFLTEYEPLNWDTTHSSLWEAEPLAEARPASLPLPPKLSLNLEAFGISDPDFSPLPIPLYTSSADSRPIATKDAEGSTSTHAPKSLEASGKMKQKFDSSKSDPVSTTVEPKDQKKKIRRRLSNRESARRSRARRQSQLDTLEVQVAELRVSNAALLKKAQDAAQRLAEHSKDNEALREEIAMLRRTLEHWTGHELTPSEVKDVESVRIKEEV